MLNMSQVEQRKSSNRDVAAGVTSIEEGVGLIAIRTGGVLTVKPGVGGANTEEFAGVAINERTAPALMPLVYKAKVVQVSAGVYGIQLTRNVVGTPRVTYTSNDTALSVAGGAPSAGQYRVVSSNIIEVNSADLGKELQVVYTYAPLISDLYQLGGDNSPVTFSSLASAIGVTGVLEAGVAYTSNFDPTVDWAGWTPTAGIKVGANGVFTNAAGTGATVKGRVIAAPTVDSPFLGIDFQVGV